MDFLKLVLGLGLLLGLGDREVRSFERLAAEDIRSRVQGESAMVTVKATLGGVISGAAGKVAEVEIRASRFSTPEVPLFVEPWRSTRGSVGTLRLTLSDFVLAGLRVDRLEATIPDCRFDLGLATRHRKLRLSRSGVGTGVVRVLQGDLAAFILHRFREIKRVKVTLLNGLAIVEGFGEFLIVRTEFLVIAKLAAEDGVRLVLSEPRVFFDGIEADAAARQVVLDAITPVIDLDKDLGLFGAVYVREIHLKNGVLEAHGDARVPIDPRPGAGTPRR